MKKLILVLFLVPVFAVFTLNNYLAGRVLPNVYLDDANLGGKTRAQVLTLLAQLQTVPISVKIKDRVYTYSPSQLGVTFDLNATARQIFGTQTETFLQRVVSFYRARELSRRVIPVIIVSQKFHEHFQKTVYDFSTRPDEVSVDQDNKQLVFTSNKEKYIVDSKALEQAIRSNYGSGKQVVARLQRLAEEKPITLTQYNEGLGRIATKAIIVSLPTIDTPITIPPDELRRMLIVSYDNEKQQLGIDVDEKKLAELAQSKVTQLLRRRDLTVDVPALKQNLVSLATSRFNNIDSSFIQGTIIQIPQSDGKIADKYIEIDIKQQRMYLWEHGNTIATHRVSSGLYYPTPPGKYKILNKAPNAFSDIYHVWMPYWMAFYRDPKINAYLGIHELPYWVTGDGTQIRRPRDFIGSPHTGGCVSLDVGEAQLVYNWAEIGMPVVIYE